MNEQPAVVPQQQSASTGMLVLALSEILRLEPGDVRDLALANIYEYAYPVIGGPGGVPFSQLCLTAKVVNESDWASKLISQEFKIPELLAECDKLLNEYYPQFRESPRVQQMLTALKLLTQTEEELKQRREISATDVFGVQAQTPPPRSTYE